LTNDRGWTRLSIRFSISKEILKVTFNVPFLLSGAHHTGNPEGASAPTEAAREAVSQRRIAPHD
jgi:hypothetical protein